MWDCDAREGDAHHACSVRRFAMCYEFERDYLTRRAEEARKEMQKAEERMKQPKPAAPAAAPARGVDQPEPVPV